MSISRKITEGAGSGSGGGSAGGYVDDVFSTYLYTGDGADQDIVNGVDLDGEGGLVWVKCRDQAFAHILCDTERGPNNKLETQSPSGEVFKASISAFNSNGFSLDAGSLETNSAGPPSPGKYTSWTFRKARSFFDVVTYTGNGVQNRAVPHGLGCTPGMVIIKSVSVSRDWHVWHNSFPEWTGGTTEGDISGSNDVGRLQLSNNTAFLSGYGGFTYANDTAFGLYRSNLDENVVGEEYVAYVFAHDDSDEGMIQCGSYTGDRNNGVEIDLGWEPQWILIKCTSSGGDAFQWLMLDTMRGLTESDSQYLYANVVDAELAAGIPLAVPTATGFKLPAGTGWNTNNETGEEYIYMAIRRPNKPAEEFEADELFAISEGDGLAEPAYTSGFPVDMEFIRSPETAAGSTEIASRLTGAELMRTNSDNAGSPEVKTTFDYMEGWRDQDQYAGNYLSWMWRRAPGFFDTVAYEGNGQAGREVPHNLGVAPEMIWFKGRDQARNWAVYAEPTGYSLAGQLNFDTEFQGSNVLAASPNASNIILGDSANSNYVQGWTYIAYLFASVPGICDIGTYTGNGPNGATQDIDCGFTNGARFVLIKRTDGTGNWMYFDVLRGGGGVNLGFPLALNTTDAQLTTGSYAYVIPSGFRVNTYSLNGDEWNTNLDGAEYIYMAIA